MQIPDIFFFLISRSLNSRQSSKCLQACQLAACSLQLSFASPCPWCGSDSAGRSFSICSMIRRRYCRPSCPTECLPGRARSFGTSITNRAMIGAQISTPPGFKPMTLGRADQRYALFRSDLDQTWRCRTRAGWSETRPGPWLGAFSSAAILVADNQTRMSHRRLPLIYSCNHGCWLSA